MFLVKSSGLSMCKFILFANTDNFTFSFWFECIFFVLPDYYMLPVLCWMRMVRVGTLVRFLILEGKLSIFHHWMWYNLWVCHQFSSLTQPCPTLCDPMNRSMPGLPVHHQLPKSTQTHVHRVSDAIQPFHPLSSPSPPAPNPSQHQDLFRWVNSSHEVAKVLEFQLQHQSLQWTLRTDIL